MTRLDIDGNGQSRSAVRPGFWRRQFMPATTRAQRIFDVLFGVVAPVLCFAFDPIVFKDNFGFAGGLFPEYQSYAYMVSGVEILLLLIWLFCGRQLSPRTRLLGGMLVAGALFSGLIGVIILPFTLIGLFVFGIGIFGFVPFLTGLVYLPQRAKRISTGEQPPLRQCVDRGGRCRRCSSPGDAGIREFYCFSICVGINECSSLCQSAKRRHGC